MNSDCLLVILQVLLVHQLRALKLIEGKSGRSFYSRNQRIEFQMDNK